MGQHTRTPSHTPLPFSLLLRLSPSTTVSVALNSSFARHGTAITRRGSGRANTPRRGRGRESAPRAKLEAAAEAGHRRAHGLRGPATRGIEEKEKNRAGMGALCVCVCVFRCRVVSSRVANTCYQGLSVSHGEPQVPFMYVVWR